MTVVSVVRKPHECSGLLCGNRTGLCGNRTRDTPSDLRPLDTNALDRVLLPLAATPPLGSLVALPAANARPLGEGQKLCPVRGYLLPERDFGHLEFEVCERANLVISEDRSERGAKLVSIGLGWALAAGFACVGAETVRQYACLRHRVAHVGRIAPAAMAVAVPDVAQREVTLITGGDGETAVPTVGARAGELPRFVFVRYEPESGRDLLTAGDRLIPAAHARASRTGWLS